jgi:drug/metabolite transporter (DMT)-like permease
VKVTAYLAASFQTLIAAGTFLVAKDATIHFSPFRLAWFRIVLSGILILAVHSLVRKRAPRPSRRDILGFLILGILGITINQTLFLVGLSFSLPLHASLLYAFTPVLVLFGAVLHLGERLTRTKILGVAAAVVGVSLVLTAKGLDLTQGPLRGDLLILVAVFAWSAYTLVGKRMLAGHDPFTVTTWAFAFGALSMLPAGYWVWRDFDPASPGVTGWLEILYLSVFTSLVAFTLWYVALKRLEATQLAVFANLQPPLTALLAWLILGDVPEELAVAGGILVLFGVTVVQFAGRRRRPAAPLQ